MPRIDSLGPSILLLIIHGHHQTYHSQQSDKLLFQNQLSVVCVQMRLLAAAAKLEFPHGISLGKASHPLSFMPCLTHVVHIFAWQWDIS